MSRFTGILVAAMAANLASLPVLRAQEAEVRQALDATLAAWNAGDVDSFVPYFADDNWGFYLDGGLLADAVSPQQMAALYEAGLKPNFELRHVGIAVYGNTAVSAAYMVGSIDPGFEGETVQGTWRYTETRIKEGGVWKIVQYHFSPLTP